MNPNNVAFPLIQKSYQHETREKSYIKYLRKRSEGKIQGVKLETTPAFPNCVNSILIVVMINVAWQRNTYEGTSVWIVWKA